MNNLSFHPKSQASRTLISAGRAVCGNDVQPHRFELTGDQTDWELLLSLARRNGMVPLLHSLLRKWDLDWVPAQIWDTLDEEFHYNLTSQLVSAGELLRILPLLEEHGITAIPFKGPVLAAMAYGDLSLRPSGDLDLLVRERDVPGARRLLLSAGYRPQYAESSPRGAVAEHEDHHHVLLRETDGLTVELHWRFTPPSYAFRPDLEALWRRLETVNISGTAVRTLSPDDMLLILCVHGSKHGWPRLSWICDVAALVCARPQWSWDLIWERARQTGSERMLFLGLCLASDLLDTSMPAGFERGIRGEAQIRAISLRIRQRLLDSAVSTAVIEEFAVRLSTLSGPRAKVRHALHFLKRRLTPNEADLAAISLPGRHAPLYFFFRPIRLARRYGGGCVGGSPAGRDESAPSQFSA